MFKVYTQDSFCFPGCLPEGYGPDSNGDTFETREEAIDDAVHMLLATLAEYLPASGISNEVATLATRLEYELRHTGETSADLPYIDEETGEESSDGSRHVSFSVVDIDAQEDDRERHKEAMGST
jgi:hypothetical protein